MRDLLPSLRSGPCPSLGFSIHPKKCRFGTFSPPRRADLRGGIDVGWRVAQHPTLGGVFLGKRPAPRRSMAYDSSGGFWTLCSVAYSSTSLFTTSNPSS